MLNNRSKTFPCRAHLCIMLNYEKIGLIGIEREEEVKNITAFTEKVIPLCGGMTFNQIEAGLKDVLTQIKCGLPVTISPKD